MTGEAITCPIWGTPAALLRAEDYGRDRFIDSPRAGGVFCARGLAEGFGESLKDDDKATLTTWIIDQHRLGNVTPIVDRPLINRLSVFRPLTVSERRNRLILYLAQKNKRLGAGVRIAGTADEEFHTNLNELRAWTECKDDQEPYYLVGICEDENLVKRGQGSGQPIVLTGKGYTYLEELQSKRTDSSQGFIAMWFDNSMEAASESGIAEAIRQAGYKPLRIDQKQHVNKIDDEIVAEIRRSRFLVADFTSEPDKPRGGVYFEAGFAYGLNIPVIWTCREDAIADVHFDTRQFNHIVWKSPEDLRSKLKNRIEAVIGEGPLKPPE